MAERTVDNDDARRSFRIFHNGGLPRELSGIRRDPLTVRPFTKAKERGVSS